MDVNTSRCRHSTRKIRQKLEKAREIRITTPQGLTYTTTKAVLKAIAADGNYTMPGTGGNLPAGEVYAPPNGKKVGRQGLY